MMSILMIEDPQKVGRLHVASVIDSGDGYGENVAVYFWDSCLRVLPATGDGTGEDGMLERKGMALA